METIGGLAAQFGLRLAVGNSDDSGAPQTLFRLEPAPRKLKISTVATPVSLRELLLATQQPRDLLTRRRLALTLAYSILQFHESAFSDSDIWSEDQIYFYPSPASIHGINFLQPYVQPPLGDASSNNYSLHAKKAIFHPNIGILRLGLLLIELHTWVPIDKFRDDHDTTSNADYAAALRVLDIALGDCYPTYKSAIRACLEIDWVPAGSRVSLEDSTTCDGLYRNVILPIQEEIEWGEKMALKHGGVATLAVT
jgi:hypothetical protein